MRPPPRGAGMTRVDTQLSSVTRTVLALGVCLWCIASESDTLYYLISKRYAIAAGMNTTTQKKKAKKLEKLLKDKNPVAKRFKTLVSYTGA